MSVALRLSSQEPPLAATYVGQETCLASGCHAGPYGEKSDFQGAGPFRETMHQKIHLRPTPQTVVIDRLFEKDTVIRKVITQVRAPGKDTLLISLSKSADRTDYLMRFSFSGGGDSTPFMKVAYTYGGNGWIQRYLIEIGGSFYVAPFQYILPGYKERTSYGGGFYYLDMDRWFEVDSITLEGRFYQWSSNQFRKQSWDKNCSQCHVNGFDIEQRVNGADTSWLARWVGARSGDSALQDQNILIGCESCHGPGSEHAANPTASNIFSPGALPKTMAGTDLKLDLCNQCHNRMVSTAGTYSFAYDEENRRPFVPGNSLKEYIRDEFSAMRIWGDKMVSYAHHQAGQDFLRSAPYQKHVFKDGCWSCHRVHSTGKDGLPYQLDRNWYTLRSGEGCLSVGCHASHGDTAYSPIVGRTVNRHTQHSQSASACVNCHFTKVATIAFDDLPNKPLYEFSYHGFKVIRPNATREFMNGAVPGMLNTCAESCHRNGRGSRNRNDSVPEAPAFGTVDRNYGSWREQSDLDLADSLWFHYQRLYAEYLSATRESSAHEGASRITSVAPNPSSGPVSVGFTLAASGGIELGVYGSTGNLVRTLAAGRHAAGSYSVRWDGNDELGGAAPNGAYLLRLVTPAGRITRKVVLAR